MRIASDRRYAQTHEWVKVEEGIALIGISDYAQEQLTDIIFIDVPEVRGQRYDAGAEICALESVKAVAYIYSPVAGTLIEVNDRLKSTPEFLNQDPYGEGWILKLTPEEPLKTVELLPAEKYEAYLQTLEH